MNSKVTISLLVLYLASPQGATLRCRCIKTEPNFIHPKFIDNIIIIPSGPHCPKAAIIATLQSFKQVCLNPDAASVKKIIGRMIDGSKNPEANQ